MSNSEQPINFESELDDDELFEQLEKDEELERLLLQRKIELKQQLDGFDDLGNTVNFTTQQLKNWILKATKE
ncbi:hypothetical protein AYI70_g3221 [Smittium culicis]|uniref:Uncharacterized protein n=1 Tax=Smittium culicis TaxID=133412 RepID=A0A1R1Y529_9FUNG|nr:hypothetical protein AYI70_g6666 [Smittium culicis]OMJ21864.1 hypothetical protein AYI70_g3221 [Smittium culicis]